MSDRKAELELKKERLKRMREEKVTLRTAAFVASATLVHNKCLAFRNVEDEKKSKKMRKMLPEVFEVMPLLSQV